MTDSLATNNGELGSSATSKFYRDWFTGGDGAGVAKGIGVRHLVVLGRQIVGVDAGVRGAVPN